MMHKVFLPWLKLKRAQLGLKSCIVGTSSVSEVMPMPGFGLVYTASKAMSSYVGRAINWEVKNSEYADLIDTQVLFPGGTFTNLFKRPESSKFARMNANTCCCFRIPEFTERRLCIHMGLFLLRIFHSRHLVRHLGKSPKFQNSS